MFLLDGIASHEFGHWTDCSIVSRRENHFEKSSTCRIHSIHHIDLRVEEEKRKATTTTGSICHIV